MSDFEIGNVKQYLKAAVESKYYPGLPELVFTCLARGGTLAQVKSRFGILDVAHKTWLEQHPEYKAAIELGIEASTDRLERIGSECLTAEYFQNRVWDKLITNVGRKYYAEDKEAVQTQEVNIRWAE